MSQPSQCNVLRCLRHQLFAVVDVIKRIYTTICATYLKIGEGYVRANVPFYSDTAQPYSADCLASVTKT